MILPFAGISIYEKVIYFEIQICTYKQLPYFALKYFIIFWIFYLYK